MTEATEIAVTASAVSEPVEISTDVKPVPAETPAADYAPAGDESAKEANADETAEQPEHKSRRQRQLERARTAQANAEGRAAELEKQLAEAKKATAPAEAQDLEPQRDTYETYEEFNKEQAKWAARQEYARLSKADREAQAGTKQQQDQQTANAELAKNWAQREDAFKATAEDYQEVVTDFVQDPQGLRTFSDGARRLIVESDVGPQVLHALASDSALAERISGLSPVRQIAEIGKLESKFDAPAAETETETTETKSSKAPSPPTPPKGGKSPSKDPQKMSIAELDKLAAASGSKWARH